MNTVDGEVIVVSIYWTSYWTFYWTPRLESPRW